MHINKANKSTKRLPQGQTQQQASFSKPLKTNFIPSFFPSFFLSFFLPFFFFFLPKLIKIFRYTSVSILIHFLYSVLSHIWVEKGFRFKKYWVAPVSKPAILGWFLFCLTVRQYQTHNIQYFTVCDSFFLYHITVLFRPNKQWVGFWKLSICSFLVMTFHQQLMNILFFLPDRRSLFPPSSTPG